MSSKINIQTNYLAEIVDEMLAILSDRNRIMQKHEWENTNAKWNEFLNQGFRKED